MEYNTLGKTGLKVSKICFGSLTIGPLQRNLTIEDGTAVIEKAADQGINFIDTADLYGTYPYIKRALKKYPDIIVASKSYAYDKITAQDTLERALRELDRDYIDIFLLHEQEGPLTLKGHREALDYFIQKKQEGIIRAVGISTHYVAAVKSAALMNEIDVIHPIINLQGVGIIGGSLEQMVKAVKLAFEMGKGIYAMKPLGGGHLIPHYKEALEYIFDFPYLHSIAIGMQRIEEVIANVSFLNTGKLNSEIQELINNYKRELLIQDWCLGCGSCVKSCPQGALELDDLGKAMVDKRKCILCGYCSSACNELAIKVI